MFSNKIKKKLVDISDYAKDNDINVISLKYNNAEKIEFVASLKKGSVFSSWGAVFAPNGKIIDGVLPYEQILRINKSEIMGRSLSYVIRKNKKYNTNAFATMCVYGNCYGHWIHECLPKLFLLKDSHFFDEVETIVLGHECKSSFYKKTLDMLGCAAKKIVYVDDETNAVFDKLYFSSFPGIRMHCPAEWTYQKYHSLAEGICEKHKDMPRYKKIYISRNKAKVRHTLNENKLFEMLESLGYKLIYMEDYSLEEQIVLFHSAEKIISPNGSGLTNLVFCKPDRTSVLDIFPSIRLETLYMEISEVKKIKYYEYIEDNPNNLVFRTGSDKKNGECDIIVDLEKIKPVIEKMES